MDRSSQVRSAGVVIKAKFVCGNCVGDLYIDETILILESGAANFVFDLNARRH